MSGAWRLGSDVPPPCYMSHPCAAGSVGVGGSSQAAAAGFCSFVILNFVTKRTQSLNSFIPHLYLYQRGSISGSPSPPLPVPLSSFRNLPPLLRYDFSFILAFHTSELTDSRADGTKKRKKNRFIHQDFTFFSLTPTSDKIWFLLGPSQGERTPSCWAG